MEITPVKDVDAATDDKQPLHTGVRPEAALNRGKWSTVPEASTY